MTTEEFVLTDNLDLVLAKFAKLNKKAVKLNVTPITVTVTDVVKIEEYKDGNGNKQQYHSTKLIINGETPKLNGWSLNSVKIFDDAMGLMINTVPDHEMPVEFRETGCACNHCNTNRNRNSTYILEKDLKELTEDEMRYI